MYTSFAKRNSEIKISRCCTDTRTASTVGIIKSKDAFFEVEVADQWI